MCQKYCICVQALLFDSDGLIQSLEQDLHTLQSMLRTLGQLPLEEKSCTILYTSNILKNFKQYSSIKVYDQDNFLIALEL